MMRLRLQLNNDVDVFVPIKNHPFSVQHMNDHCQQTITREKRKKSVWQIKALQRIERREKKIYIGMDERTYR